MPDPQLADPVLTPEEHGLMVACIAWLPSRGPLADDERVKAYLAADSVHGPEVVRKLQLFLLKSRFAER